MKKFEGVKTRNYHGPLKLLNDHGVDGKSWFKEQGPLWVHGRGYRIVYPVLPRFSECTLSHVPLSPSTGKKMQEKPVTLCFM